MKASLPEGSPSDAPAGDWAGGVGCCQADSRWWWARGSGKNVGVGSVGGGVVS